MYLVFDVGGTFVKYAWMSMDGNIQEKGKYPTPTKEGESVPEFVESLGQIYDKYKDQGVEGIALSLPGLIDAENGIIRNGGGIKYLKDAHLAELLGARCDGVKISMENDGKCAALAEVWMGNAKGCKNAAVVILGTGIGGGIVINGQLVYGHDGFAGELGHVIVDRNGRACGCGRKGCLETYCSATGVARTAREFLVQRTEPSLLRNIPADEIQSKDVYDAAVKGDKLAQDIFEFTGRILGQALADFIAFSSPEAIVLFGGLAKSGDYIMKPIQKAIDENILKIYAGKTKLLLSQLKDADAAVLGASALGWEVKEN